MSCFDSYSTPCHCHDTDVDSEEREVSWAFDDHKQVGGIWPLCAWSPPHSLSHAIHNMGLAKHDGGGDDDRPTKVRFIDEDESTDDIEQFECLGDAVRRLKHLKRQVERVNETSRMKTVDAEFLKKFGKPRPGINHIVVLMMENRTFDGTQGDYMNDRYKSGEVKRSKWDLDGKDLYSYINKVEDDSGKLVDFPVWTRPRNDPDIFKKENMAIPSGPAGPVEKFHFLNLCVYETMRPTDDHLKKGPTMGGFAQQYHLKTEANPNEDGSVNAPELAATCFKTRHSPVMYVYNKNQMPVFTEIMEKFGCSDTHFSSAPCQTWPNRLFAVCGTCYGYYNNIPYVNPYGELDETAYFQSDEVDKLGSMEKVFGSYDTDTVFHRLNDNKVSWGIYHGQVSLAVITTKLKYELPDIAAKVHTLEDFAADCELGDLPQFVWIEPNYDAGSPDENDMHPPSNVLSGQHLVKDIYNSLRANEELFKKTLFIVTCDEGVGQFDHVKPPRAVDPVVGQDHHYVAQADGSPYDMTSNPFTRYGTRTPNLMVSPWIQPKSVCRPVGPNNDEASAPYPFDHTSLIRTAFDLLIADPKEHLTERDKAAPSFVHCLGTAPTNMGPKSMTCPDYEKVAGNPKQHTCHCAGDMVDLSSGQEQGFGIGNMFKVPHALEPTFTVELAAFFGL